jgi:uncharacterized protein (DUF1499 family)
MLALVEPIRSATAIWSRRFAAFSIQLVVLTAILHRVSWLTTPMAISLIVFCFILATIALLLGLTAIGQIWRHGYKGAWSAAFGIFGCLALFAWPAAYAPVAVKLPAINDITTDANNPPQFEELAKLRPSDANPTRYPGAVYAAQQATAYADVRPLLVPRGAVETFELVGDVIERLRWKIVAEHKPEGEAQPGIIEATDRTLVLGFTDDIVVRVSGSDKEARIDARSASRYGMHDLGRNADRLRAFFKEVWARLDESVGGDAIARKGKRDFKRLKERSRASKAAGKPPASARSGAPHEPEPKARRRSRAESRDRDRSQ